jgi:hypothetical protein
MKDKKPKSPTSLWRWENVVTLILFLGMIWLVIHLPMMPG